MFNFHISEAPVGTVRQHKMDKEGLVIQCY